jgi:hypothetical protein
LLVGSKCIVFDEETKEWLRAEVTDYEADSTTFKLIDYQVDKTILVDRNVKTMSQLLRQHPPFSVRCSMSCEETFAEAEMSQHFRSIVEG